MVAVSIPENNIQPRREKEVNIFMLIQDILAEQKVNSKKYSKFSVLAMVDRLNIQYQNYLSDWAQKTQDMKDVMAKEFQELKESLNTGGFLFASIPLVIGAIAGFALGGPSGLAMGVFAAGALVGAGIGADKLGKGSKVFFDDKEEIDSIKFQEREDNIKIITNEAKHIQDKANVKQGEISRTMQIELEALQQIETAVSNVINALLRKFSESNMMGRA